MLEVLTAIALEASWELLKGMLMASSKGVVLDLQKVDDWEFCLVCWKDELLIFGEAYLHDLPKQQGILSFDTHWAVFSSEMVVHHLAVS